MILLLQASFIVLVKEALPVEKYGQVTSKSVIMVLQAKTKLLGSF